MRAFCEKIGFPEEAITYLESVSPQVDAAKLDAAGEKFLADDPAHLDILQAEADRTGLPVPTVQLLFLLHLMPELHRRFDAAGIDEKIFWDTAEDLTFKLRECREDHGVWGNTVVKWYRKFFDVNLIKLGRLQYEVSEWKQETDVPPVHHGDRVFKIHIPSCGPLTPESVEESFQIAKKFFRERGVLKTEYFPVMCSSWLVYPPHHDLFPEGSNMRKFQELFTVVSTMERQRDFAIVFHRPYTEDFDSLPEDTRLQRNFKKFLQNGGKMGLGRGILFR